MKAFILLLLATAIFAKHSHFFLTQEYVNEINKIQNSWTAGYNERWENFSFESIKSQMGTILDEPEEIKLPLLEVEPMSGLPESFDSRQ
jgi:uncharacterized protein (DUF1015 family)